MSMRKNKHNVISSLAISGIALALAIMIAGCGGGGGGLAAAGTALAVFSDHDKNDNPIIPVLPGHPGRLVFYTDRSPAFPKSIVATDATGDAVVGVAYNLNSEQTPYSTINFTFTDPTVSQNGLTVFYATDYFTTVVNATRTTIMSSNIDGYPNTIRFKDPDNNIANPRFSWDGTKVAYTTYSSSAVTSLAHPINYTISGTTTPSTTAQIGLNPTGDKLVSKAKGYKDMGTTAPTTCSDATYTFTSSLQFYSIASSTGVVTQKLDPDGHYICFKYNDDYYMLMHVTDYSYGLVEDASTTCSGKSDCADSTTTGAALGCYNSHCAYRKNSDAYITFEWWPQKNGGPLGTKREAYTLLDAYDRVANKHYGAGANFFSEQTFKSYDLWVAKFDSVTQKIIDPQRITTGDAPEMTPCFSPADNNSVFFSQGVLDPEIYDYDIPASAKISKLNISTGQITDVLSDGSVYKYCAFSPSGKRMLFSKHNGKDYDIYTMTFSGTTPTSSPTKVLDIGGNEIYPTFSPDGNYFAFQSDESTDTDIYVYNILNSSYKNITRVNSGADTMPAWTP